MNREETIVKISSIFVALGMIMMLVYYVALYLVSNNYALIISLIIGLIILSGEIYDVEAHEGVTE